MKKFTKKFHIVNLLIIFSLIILPMSVLASVPTTTSFDRHNMYLADGFRDGGYYVVRQNPATAGFMNMSHEGNTNEFNITTYNINNVTLDFDLMYQERSFLFGWANVTWEDAVASLGRNIYIDVNSHDGINKLKFADQPNVRVRVIVDGEIYRDYAELKDVEVDLNGLSAGNHVVVIEFDHLNTTYNIFSWLLQIAIIMGLIILTVRYIRGALFGEEEYYMQFGG